MSRPKLKFVLFFGAALSMTAVGNVVHAQDRAVITPDKINWADVPSMPGVQSALILGSPGKAGPYTLRAKFPPNYQLGPHTHTDTRILTVISGSWSEGFGEHLDQGKATPMPTGSLALIPANEVHFDIVGPEGAVIQVTGTGEAHTAYRSSEDDPQNKYKK